jgi:hypothetical protein
VVTTAAVRTMPVARMGKLLVAGGVGAALGACGGAEAARGVGVGTAGTGGSAKAVGAAVGPAAGAGLASVPAGLAPCAWAAPADRITSEAHTARDRLFMLPLASPPGAEPAPTLDFRQEARPGDFTTASSTASPRRRGAVLRLCHAELLLGSNYRCRARESRLCPLRPGIGPARARWQAPRPGGSAENPWIK